VALSMRCMYPDCESDLRVPPSFTKSGMTLVAPSPAGLPRSQQRQDRLLDTIIVGVKRQFWSGSPATHPLRQQPEPFRAVPFAVAFGSDELGEHPS